MTTMALTVRIRYVVHKPKGLIQNRENVVLLVIIVIHSNAQGWDGN
jgi:hypothetical protein